MSEDHRGGAGDSDRWGVRRPVALPRAVDLLHVGYIEGEGEVDRRERLEPIVVAICYCEPVLTRVQLPGISALETRLYTACALSQPQLPTIMSTGRMDSTTASVEASKTAGSVLPLTLPCRACAAPRGHDSATDPG